MQMVEPDAGFLETRLVAGEIACADCGGELRPWGYARRRTLRDHGKPLSVRPRRSRCRSCMVTHVLLPVLLLLRRADLAATIGEALVARHIERLRRAEVVAGAGAPTDTVRGWLRRFEARAEEIRSQFLGLAHGWDAELGPSNRRVQLPATPWRHRPGCRGWDAPLWSDPALEPGGRRLRWKAALQHQLPLSHWPLSRSLFTTDRVGGTQRRP